MSDPFLSAVVCWAEQQADIVAVVLTGSRARPEGPVDASSDYDVELFTRAPYRYAGEAWLEEIAPLWVCLRLTNPDGSLGRLCFFAGGEKVDLTIRPAATLDVVAAAPTLDPLRDRGYRVLLDRTGALAVAPPPRHVAPRLAPPTQAEFLAVATEFWFEAAHLPPLLARGELWVAKHRDWTMKRCLLRMIEWHARATDGDDLDVWHIGTRMARWAGPDVWERVHGTFGGFDAAAAWRALLASTELFADLSGEVARRWELALPDRLAATFPAYADSFARPVRASGPAGADRASPPPSATRSASRFGADIR